MAFVGFWMLPLAFSFYAVHRFFAIFGFDFFGWLGNPATIEKLTGYLDTIIVFVGKAWDFAEPYVSPVIEFIDKFV
jgi:hypothetical protein